MFHAVARMTKSSTVYAAEKKYSLGISCVTAASAIATARVTTAKILLLIGPYLPNIPEGLNASVASSRPKDTAGAHEGPKNVEVKDSASPSTKAPSSVPRIEPMPPSTHTAK